jgi:hypothetical protein
MSGQPDHTDIIHRPKRVEIVIGLDASLLDFQLNAVLRKM